MQKQLDLNLPKKRVALVKAPSNARVTIGGASINLEVDLEAFIGYTEWNGVAPPLISGFWDLEITMPGADPSMEVRRLWFDAPSGHWTFTKDGVGHYIEHKITQQFLRWRGLHAPWPGGYSYPVPGCRLSPEVQEAVRLAAQAEFAKKRDKLPLRPRRSAWPEGVPEDASGLRRQRKVLIG